MLLFKDKRRRTNLYESCKTQNLDRIQWKLFKSKKCGQASAEPIKTRVLINKVNHNPNFSPLRGLHSGFSLTFSIFHTPLASCFFFLKNGEWYFAPSCIQAALPKTRFRYASRILICAFVTLISVIQNVLFLSECSSKCPTALLKREKLKILD